MFKIRTLEVDDLIISPEGVFVIRAVHDDGGLALQERDGTRSLHMTQEEFERGFAACEVSIKKAYSPDRYDRAPKGHIATAPDESYSPKKRILQLILIEFDKAPVGLSDQALRSVIEQTRLPAELASIEWRPSPGTLRRAINRYGEAGSRPLCRMKRKTRTQSLNADSRVESMRATIVKWYYQKRQRTISDAYNRLCVVIDYLNRRARRAGIESTQLERLSHEWVRTSIRSNESYEFLKQKFGEKIARKRYVGVAEGRYAKRHLDVVMIDATVVDSVLVFTEDRKCPLGRPTITAAIDVCTRMILGIFITFEPASIYAVTNCIKDMLTPKEEKLQKEYPDIKGKWCAYGKPLHLILDNGLENVGTSLQDALLDLGINPEWAPVRTPQYKAYIERFFGTLNTYLFHKLPGGLPGDIKARRELDIDPAKMACVTIDKLQELVRQFIVEVYQYEPHRGTNTIPLQHWTTLANKHGIDTITDLRAINEACGYAVNATLTRQGIQCRGLRFHDAAATTGLLRDLQPLAPRGRRRAAINRVPVKIKFDPSDISGIHVWNERDSSYVRLPNVQKEYGAGTSLWLHRTLTEWAKAEQLEFRSEEERVQAKRRLLKRIESAGAISVRKAKRIGALMEHNARIEVHKAEPRHDGNSVSVPVETGMETRADGGELPKGFLRGREKRARTMRRKARASSAPDSKRDDSTIGVRSALRVEDPEKFAAKIETEEGWN